MALETILLLMALGLVAALLLALATATAKGLARRLEAVAREEAAVAAQEARQVTTKRRADDKPWPTPSLSASFK